MSTSTRITRSRGISGRCIVEVRGPGGVWRIAGTLVHGDDGWLAHPGFFFEEREPLGPFRLRREARDALVEHTGAVLR